MGLTEGRKMAFRLSRELLKKIYGLRNLDSSASVKTEIELTQRISYTSGRRTILLTTE